MIVCRKRKTESKYHLRSSAVWMGWVPKNRARTIPGVSLDFRKWRPVNWKLLQSLANKNKTKQKVSKEKFISQLCNRSRILCLYPGDKGKNVHFLLGKGDWWTIYLKEMVINSNGNLIPSIIFYLNMVKCCKRGTVTFYLRHFPHMVPSIPLASSCRTSRHWSQLLIGLAFEDLSWGHSCKKEHFHMSVLSYSKQSPHP